MAPIDLFNSGLPQTFNLLENAIFAVSKKKKCYKAKFNKTRYASERNVEDLWNVEEVWLWLKSVRCQLGGNKVQGVTFKVGCQNILDMKFPGM